MNRAGDAHEEAGGGKAEEVKRSWIVNDLEADDLESGLDPKSDRIH